MSDSSSPSANLSTTTTNALTSGPTSRSSRNQSKDTSNIATGTAAPLNPSASPFVPTQLDNLKSEPTAKPAAKPKSQKSHKKPPTASSTMNQVSAPKPAPAAAVPKRAVKANQSAGLAAKPRHFSCPICLQENFGHGIKKRDELDPINFFAIGPCDHKVCSQCALRLRCKSQDLSCPMCKASLPFMCVLNINALIPSTESFVDSFQEALRLVSFPWPSDVSAVDLYEVRCPEAIPDIENKLLYINCNKFAVHMDDLKSIHCPIKNCALHAKKPAEASDDADIQTGVFNGTSRFRSYVDLINHLEKAHHGMTMCKLCLENRPLFISEHEVFYNAHKYRQHLHGNHTTASNSSNITQGRRDSNTYMLGHPQCKFCEVRFFDAHGLYRHMQAQHFTCTLCDREKMFRYYRNIQALRDHHAHMHYTCSLCNRDQALRSSDVMYSFKHFTEFNDHMRGIHHIQDASKYLISLPTPSAATNQTTRKAFSSKGGSQAPDADLQYVDIDVGTANPFPTSPDAQQPTANTADRANRGPKPSATVRYRDSVLRDIPANMTIAGRVTGTGRFSNMDAAEVEALQALIDANPHEHMQNTPNWTGEAPEEHFPDLAVASQPEESTGKATSIHAVHPLSVINKKAGAGPFTGVAKKTDMQASGGKNRQQALAEAFGLSAIAAHPHVHVHKLQQVLEKVAHLHLSEAYLSSYLYPWEAIQWAQKNRAELLKLESKITAFLRNSSQNSLQLKPMDYVLRGMSHLYAKYCHLNSYEYDPEPERYVSMVRRLDSALPPVLLSAAANIPLTVIFPHDPASTLGREDTSILYFVLRAGICSSWMAGSESTKGRSSAGAMGFHPQMLIVGEVIDMVMQVLEVIRADYVYNFFADEPYDAAAMDNPFYSAVAALHQEVVANNLSMDITVDYVEQSGPHVIGIGMKSRYAAAISMLYLQEAEFWDFHGHQVAVELFRYYKVQSSFVMPEVSASRQLRPAADTVEGVPETAEITTESAESERLSEDLSDYVVIDIQPDGVATESSTPPAVANDWEEAAEGLHSLSLNSKLGSTTAAKADHHRRGEQDEWESFLAEKRGRSEGDGPSGGALYVPKRSETAVTGSTQPDKVQRYVPKRPAVTSSRPAGGEETQLQERTSPTATASTPVDSTEHIPKEFLLEHQQAMAALGRQEWRPVTGSSGKVEKERAKVVEAAKVAVSNRFVGFDDDSDSDEDS